MDVQVAQQLTSTPGAHALAAALDQSDPDSLAAARDLGATVLFLVAPDGTVVRSSELFTPDVFVEEIAQRESRSVASRTALSRRVAMTAPLPAVPPTSCST